MIGEDAGADTGATPASRLHVRTVPFDAPWSWLADGWRDLWAVPRLSLASGVTFTLAAAALAFGLTVRGMESLVLALGGGFILIGPVAAVGFYETSRRLQEGEPVTLAAIARSILGAPGQLGFFGAILAFVYAAWLQIASLLFMLFLGGRPFPPGGPDRRLHGAWACHHVRGAGHRVPAGGPRDLVRLLRSGVGRAGKLPLRPRRLVVLYRPPACAIEVLELAAVERP
jgi:hypothetical protein